MPESGNIKWTWMNMHTDRHPYRNMNFPLSKIKMKKYIFQKIKGRGSYCCLQTISWTIQSQQQSYQIHVNVWKLICMGLVAHLIYYSTFAGNAGGSFDVPRFRHLRVWFLSLYEFIKKSQWCFIRTTHNFS